MRPKLRELQQKCLEIFDIVDKICKDKGIKYSLCGGTVVGAHLYKGILLWDDDIDLMMTRENYNKFFKIAPNLLPNTFSIINYQNSDLSTTWKICFTKIINESTTIVQKNGDNMGVFVDIGVYDKVPKGFLKHIDIFLCKRILTIDTGKKSGRGFINCARNLALSTILSNRRRYLMFFQKMVEIIGSLSSNYVYSELFGAYPYYNTLPYKATIFENYTTVEFEGRIVMIVRDYIDYLQTRYNRTDFNEPQNKQIPTHFLYVVDFNLPFKDYIRNKKEIVSK